MNIHSKDSQPTTVSVAEAKAKFSELLKRAENGEEFLITRHGKAIAALKAPNRPKNKKSLHGVWKGKIWMADDFDELGPEWDEYIK